MIPNMDMPVRMTTAMLFFVAGGIAAYFAVANNADIWLVVTCSFLFFIALGPVYWAQELVCTLPTGRRVNEDGKSYDFVNLENYWYGIATMWLCSLLRLGLIGGSVFLLVRAMWTGDFGDVLPANSE